jgi:hypothetical protein
MSGAGRGRTIQQEFPGIELAAANVQVLPVAKIEEQIRSNLDALKQAY